MGAPPNTVLTRRSLWQVVSTWLDYLIFGTSLVLIIAVFALSQIPLIQGGESGKTSEARAALGAMKDRARVIYFKDKTISVFSKIDLGLGKSELNGMHFKDEDFTCGGTPEQFWAKCKNVFEAEPRDLELTSNLATGSSTYNR